MSDDPTPGEQRQVGSGPDDDSLGTREGILQFAVSYLVVVAHGLLFGAAVGVALRLVARFDSELPADVTTRLVIGIFVLVPLVTFLFVALYYNADLERPEWDDGHPPISDVWMWLLVTFVGVFLVVPTIAWPDKLVAVVVAMVAVTAYIVLPFWLAHRWLREPSWELGGLTFLGSPLVIAGAVAALLVFSEHEPIPTIALAAVAVAGSVVPFALAYRSSGSGRTAARAAGWLE